MSTTTRFSPIDGIAPPAQASAVVLWSHQIDLWRARIRQRRALGALTDAQLDDIGVSRAEADQEARKPFWR